LCQQPTIAHNYTLNDSVSNPFLSILAKDYEFAFAYSESSYWAKEENNYKIIALKHNKWIAFTCPHFASSEINKEHLIQITNKNLNSQAVRNLLNSLSSNDFWILNKDSLESKVINTFINSSGDTMIRTKDIDDGINYRFEVFTNNKQRVIESYEPDSYVKENTALLDKRKFIKSRDTFLQWWTKYCH
jgi:hypothetical protein